jgi:AraC-like DNA-binding protein
MKQRTLTDPARYALQMLELLESWGIPRKAVLQRARIAAEGFADARGDARLTLAEADALFTAARELAGRSDVAFEFGLRIKPTSHGLLGLALMGCPDVHALWQLAARQQYHLTEAFRLHFERAGGGGRGSYTPLIVMPPERLAFNLEVFAVSTHNTLRLLLGDSLLPFEIRLGMAAPPHHARYQALQPTRFVFDPSQPPGVVVTLDRALLEMPLPMAAPAIVRDVERHLTSLVPQREADACWAEVVGQILRQVRGQQVTLKSVATQIGVSTRTLERRLAAEGVRFGVLCDQVRFERARALLRDGELGVAQVATTLGYRDAANFSRAFRRLAGMSPSAYQGLARHRPSGERAPSEQELNA